MYRAATPKDTNTTSRTACTAPKEEKKKQVPEPKFTGVKKPLTGLDDNASPQSHLLNTITRFLASHAPPSVRHVSSVLNHNEKQ